MPIIEVEPPANILPYSIQEQGSCKSISEAECKAYYTNHGKKEGATLFAAMSWSHRVQGCWHWKSKAGYNMVIYNKLTTKHPCSDERQCVCEKGQGKYTFDFNVNPFLYSFFLKR